MVLFRVRYYACRCLWGNFPKITRNASVILWLFFIAKIYLLGWIVVMEKSCWLILFGYLLWLWQQIKPSWSHKKQEATNTITMSEAYLQHPDWCSIHQPWGDPNIEDFGGFMHAIPEVGLLLLGRNMKTPTWKGFKQDNSEFSCNPKSSLRV